MKTRLTHFIIMLALLPVLASGCAKYDGALRVDVKADGVSYTCPEYSYDTYFPCYFEETEGGFMFSFCRYVTSSAGDQVTVLVRLNEAASFELNRPYALSGSAEEGGNYAVWDWTFKSTDGYVTFLDRWDDEDASYISGRFEFTAVDEATGRTVEVTEGVFENLSVVLKN